MAAQQSKKGKAPSKNKRAHQTKDRVWEAKAGKRRTHRLTKHSAPHHRHLHSPKWYHEQIKQDVDGDSPAHLKNNCCKQFHVLVGRQDWSPVGSVEHSVSAKDMKKILYG